MSNISPQGEQSTVTEIQALANLTALAASGSGEAIKKTGTTTFENASVGGSGSALSILTATGTVNDSNMAFTFASQPTVLVINGGVYKTTGGVITWTWDSGTLTATLSSPVGTGGSIFGLV